MSDIRFVRAYLAVGVAAIVAYHWIGSQYAYWAIAIFGAAATAAGAARQPRGERAPWACLAVGVALFVAGDIAWYVLDILGSVPASPNVSDFLYLAAYPLVVSGLFLLSRRVASGVALTIDAIIVALAVATALWPFLFATVLHGSSDPLGERLTVGVYPCWDIVYIVLAMRIALTGGLHTRRALLLVTSTILFFTGDIFWFKSVDTYVLGDWMDYMWLLAYIGFGGAALHPTPLVRKEQPAWTPVRRYLLLATPVALLPAALVVEIVVGQKFSAVDALLISALLLLVLGRLGTVMRGLAATSAELQEQNRLKDELISVVSHDLRTPLTSIMGYLELALSDDTDPETARDFLEVVKRNTSRLHRLVEDLLFVSRVQSGREALVIEALDLGTLVEETVASARPMADGADVLLEATVMSHDIVLADAHRLAEVLENLLSNAVKFTPPGGRVDVWLGRSGDALALRVTDTGVGIAQDDCRHLFDRFFRASGSEGVPGAGLGLSIVKAIVDAHGGVIDVESEVGVGTTFEVRLPLAVAEPVTVPAAA